MRKFKWVLSLTVALSCIAGPVYAASEVNVQSKTVISVSKNEQEEIKNLIYSYFDLMYSQYKTLSKVDFSRLISDNSEFKQYFEKKQEIKLYRKNEFNLKIKDQKLDIDFNSIKVNGSEAVINLTLKTQIQYSHLSEPTLENINHLITLHKDNEQWLISDDDSNDTIDPYVKKQNAIDKFIEAEKENIKKVKAEQFEYFAKPSTTNNTQTIMLTSLNLFNRTAMKNYAAANWDKRPSAWGNFDGMGGDCTNYISQIIYAGGAPEDKTGSYQWFYDGYSSRAPSWTGVNQLYSYLVGNTGTGPQGSSGSGGIYTSMTGDLIQFDFDYDSTYDHSTAIINHTTGTTAVTTVTAHTNDAYNKPLSDYPGSQRWIKLNGYAN